MVRIWDVNRTSQEPARTLHGASGRAAYLRFSPDGAKLAAIWIGREDRPAVRQAIVWDVSSWRQDAHLADQNLGYPSVWSPDATRLATVRPDGRTIAIWSLPATQPKDLTTDHAGEIVALAFSPGGEVLATGDDSGIVKLWSVATFTKQADIPAHEHLVRMLFLPDGAVLATWSPAESDVKLWRLAPVRPYATLPGHAEGVAFAQSTPDSAVLATISFEKVVRLWDTRRGMLQASFDRVLTDAYRGLVFSSDGTALAAWKQVPAQLHVWDVGTGSSRFSRREHTHFLDDVVFSPKGGILATADWQGGLRFFDALTGEQQAYFRASRHQLDLLQFSPDGRFLVTGSRDGTVKLWEAAAIPDVEVPLPVVGSQE